MPHSLTALGGEEWERLGLPAVGEDEQDTPTWGVSWESLLPMLPAPGAGALHGERLALVHLDALRDPEGAAALLGALDRRDEPAARWLLLQVALELGSEEMLEAWLEGAQSPLDRVGGEFIRQLLFGGGDGGEQWSGEGRAQRIGRAILLGRRGAWDQLATAVEESDPLLAVALRTILGQADRQGELLGRLGSEPLYRAELMLDLALDGKGDLGEALVARGTALAEHEALLPEACASQMMLMLRGDGPARERPVLNPKQAASAWWHLEALVDRADGAPRARWYLERASRTAAPLEAVMRICAAQLLIAEDDWSAALDALPPAGPEGLGRLAAQLRLLGLCRLERWDLLTESLLQELERTGEEDRGLLGLMVAVVGVLGGGELLQRPPELNGPDGALTGAVLLAAHRRSDRLDQVASCYASLASVQEPALGALASFGHALALLEAGRLGEASTAFARDQALVGDEPTTLVGLAVAHHRGGESSGLVGVLERLAAQAPDPQGQTLLREAAHVAAESGDLARAAALMEALLRRSPEDGLVTLEAAAIQLRLGRYREAAELLNGAASLREDVVASADILCARGKLLHDRLGDAESAEESYRRALQAHPLHVRSLHGLYHLLVKLQRFRDLPEVLHSLLHLTKTDAGRVKLLNNLASLHLKLWRKHGEVADADKCIKYSEEALELRPENEAALKNLVTVCEGLERWQEIIRRFPPTHQGPLALRALGRALVETERWADAAPVYRRLAERAPEAEESGQAAVRAGDIYRQQLADAGAAEDCFRFAARRYPSLQVSRRLAELLRAQNRPEDLAEVLEQQLPHVDAGDREKLHVELGRLYSGALPRPDAAIAHYEAALELDPSNQEVMIALEPLLEEERRLAALAGLLERRLQVVETGPEELRLLLRLAEIAEELGDEAATLRLVSRLHYLYAGDDTAAALAERVYVGQRRFAELCDLYDRRVQALTEREGSEAERAELLRRKGDVELSEPSTEAAATETLMRAVELDPGNLQTLELLERLLSTTEDWQRLLTLYERRANHLESVTEQIASLQKAARLAQQKLGDEAETARLYERIHALDPSDAESFGFLEKKLERLKDDRRLAALLEKRAETMTSAEEVSECLVRAASIREKVGDAAKAKEIYRRVLLVDPASGRALKALARISEALESWEEFLEITKRQIDEENKPANKALLYFKCGSVLETKYQREEEAIRYYKQAIKTSAACLPALHSLRDLYSRREDWPRVVETLKTESSVWTDPKGKAGVLAQIADLYSTKLGDHGQAFKYYREAIQNHPENMRAALALFEAYANQGSFSDAAAWGEVYARQVQQRGSRAQRAEFFVHWAEVLRHIGRYEDAAQYLVRAQELRPDQHETLFGLLDLCREAPQAYDFGRAFDDLLKDAAKRGDGLAAAILFTACGVLAEQAGEVDRSLELYERALSEAGHRIRLARPMADLLVLLGREDEAVALVVRCLEEAKDESFARWIEATQWLVEHEILWRRNYERAAERCQEALEEQPNRDDIRLLLAQVQVMLKQPDRAMEEYQRVCDKLAKHGLDLLLLAQRYHALGLAAEKTGNQQAAESSWRRAAELAPEWPYPQIALARARSSRGEHVAAEADLERAGGNHIDMLRARAALAARQKNHERSASLLGEVVGSPDADASDRVLMARELVAGGNGARGLALLREVIGEAGDYVPAIEELGEVAARIGDAGLARRAAQAVALAMGGKLPKPAPLARGAVPKPFWARLEKELARSPVDGLWHLLRDPLDRRFAPDPPPTELMVYPEVQLAAAQMGALFGTRLDIVKLNQPGTFMLLFGNRLMVATDVSALRILEARTLLALALTMVKLGYGPLMRLSLPEKMELARRLAELLTGERDRYPDAAELLASQPRGKQRQVNRVVGQQRISPAVVDEVARAWLAALDAVAIKVALLLTENLASLARILALQAGMPEDQIEAGGLLAAVPGVTTIVEYYLSDDFQQMRGMLSVGEES